MAPPGRLPLEQLRASGGNHEEWTLHLRHNRLEQVEEVVGCPMHIFDEDDRRALMHELLEELGPRIVQALSHPQRVQVFAGVKPERQTEVAASAEPLRDDGRRVALQDSEVLAQYLAKRPIGGAVTV